MLGRLADPTSFASVARWRRQVSITSRTNPLVARFRAARNRRRNDPTVIEGRVLLLEAIRAGWSIEAIAGLETALADPELQTGLDDLGAAAPRISVVSPSVLQAMSPVRSPSGVVALARPRPSDLSAVLAHGPRLIPVLVDVQDPGNVGAAVRAAEAAGATGLLLAGTSADPFGWKALRGSMGSAFRLPISHEGSGLDIVHALRAAHVAVMATAPHGDGDLWTCDLTGDVALLLGAEGSGLPADLLATADGRISIPMTPPVDSLNVAVTAALLCYEACRQRRGLDALRPPVPAVRRRA